MSDDVLTGQEPFDLAQLRELIEMMEKHGLTEVSLRHGEKLWRLRRGPQDGMTMVPAPVYAPQPAAVAAAPAPAAEAGAAPDDGTLEVTSPTVGTFYSAPSPEDPEFVKIGSSIQPDTIVCIVEAMKVFNQIPAEVGGTITEILVANGDAVEFGQPLFRVRPG